MNTIIAPSLVTILTATFAGAQDDGSLDAAAPKARGPLFAPAVSLPSATGGPVAVQDILFPTPVLFDVDGDGATELVVGDLWGSLFVHERAQREDGGFGWGERAELTYHDGSAIELPNW